MRIGSDSDRDGDRDNDRDGDHLPGRSQARQGCSPCADTPYGVGYKQFPGVCPCAKEQRTTDCTDYTDIGEEGRERREGTEYPTASKECPISKADKLDHPDGIVKPTISFHHEGREEHEGELSQRRGESAVALVSFVLQSFKTVFS